MIRPRSITLVAWIFILAGIVGLGADLWPLLTADAARQLVKLRADSMSDLALAWGTRALAMVGGVGLLHGRNWARWLLVGWMMLYVVLSLFHSPGEAAAHGVIFAPLTYLMFRKNVAPYFKSRRQSAAEAPDG